MRFLYLLIGEHAHQERDPGEIEEMLAGHMTPVMHPEDRDIFLDAIQDGDSKTLSFFIDKYQLAFNQDTRRWSVGKPWNSGN